MISFRFEYKIKKVSDIHFNYNMNAIITSIWEIYTMNERLKGKRGRTK